MNKKLLIALTLSLQVFTPFLMSGSMQAHAAKKYYPPGFVPPSYPLPSKNTTTPSKSVPTDASPQVIIKTVPVPVAVAPKPVDPLTTLLQEHRLYEALSLIDKRIQKSPTNYTLRLFRAQILREKQSFEDSVAEYQLILSKSKSKPIRARAYSGLGYTQLTQAKQMKHLGDADAVELLKQSAEGSFKQALKLDPKYPQAWLGLSELALSQNRLSEADTNIKKASRLAPNDNQVLLTRAELLLAQDKPDDAVFLINKAKQQSPSDTRASLLMGQAFLALKRYDDAIIQLQHVLEQEPDNSGALKMMSIAYENKMKPEDAEQALQKAVTLNPADVDAALTLMRAYDSHGEEDRSTLLLKTLLSNQPQQAVYQKELLLHLEKTDQWDEIFEQGSAFVTPLVTGPADLTESQQAVMNLFAQSAYIKGKGMLDRAELLSMPHMQKLAAYYRKRLKAEPTSANDRLNMLYLDPLANLPTLTDKTQLSDVENLPAAIKIAFLQGNWQEHTALLQKLSAVVSAETQDKILDTADDLRAMGDYTGAQLLVSSYQSKQPGSEVATKLAARIAADNQKAESHLKVLEMLPGKMPRTEWKETAEETLRLYGGNWHLHALLAESLLDQKEYNSALNQEKLAAQYAPSLDERNRWLKKAQKTQQKLERASRH